MVLLGSKAICTYLWILGSIAGQSYLNPSISLVFNHILLIIPRETDLTGGGGRRGTGSLSTEGEADGSSWSLRARVLYSFMYFFMYMALR